MFGFRAFKGDAISGDRQGRFVRSRKRFKAYTWKYKKTISPIASFVLLVNQICGFGMSDIPSVIREGGWLPALFANVLVCILAALCSLMLLRAMTLIPHNGNFDQRIEFNTLVKYYLSDHNFKFVALLNHLGDLCSVVSSILVFAKLVDLFLVQTLGWTLALQIYPTMSFGRIDMKTISAIYESDLIPTDEGRSVTLAITLGYVVCAVLCLRLSACALEETMGFHVCSFLALIGCTVQLAVFGLSRYLGGASTSKPPTVGNVRFGTILLTFVENYSLASSTPSWANEMTNDVKVMRTMWTSAFFSCAIYYFLGYILCLAFPANSSSIVFDILFSKTGFLTNIAICLFVVVTVLPDIVFGSISTKYNLLNLGYCGGNSAYFWGCVFPFTFTWLLSNESVFMEYLNHIGLTSVLFCDFFIPIVVYTVARESLSELSLSGSVETMDDQQSLGSAGRIRLVDDGAAKLSSSEMLLKKGTTILFGKIGSWGRLMTLDYRTKTTLELQEPKEESVNDHSTVSNANAVSQEGTAELDFLSFKIIKPPPVARPDDHQYNVISRRRTAQSVSFEEIDLYGANEELDHQPMGVHGMNNNSSNRVEIFPVDFLEKHHGPIARILLLFLGGMTILPTLYRVKSLL